MALQTSAPLHARTALSRAEEAALTRSTATTLGAARCSRVAVLAALALLLLGSVGCGEADEPDDARAAKQSWCEGGCAAAAMCGLGSNPGCASGCVNRYDGMFVRMTPEAIAAEAACVARATSCPDGIDELFDQCATEAWTGFEPTAAARETCQAMAAPFFTCNWFASFEQCASFHAVFEPEALAAWQGCKNSGTCDGLGECMSATLYSYGD